MCEESLSGASLEAEEQREILPLLQERMREKPLPWTGKNLENKHMRDPLGWFHQANSRDIVTSRMQQKSVQGKLVAGILRSCYQMEGCSVGVGRDGTHAGPQTQGAH